jgi:Lon protease-like protein
LIADLKPFLERNEVKADWESLKRMPAELVLNHLCMNLPLAREDKQALVETTDQQERARLLTALCEMALISRSGSEQTRH